MIKLLSTQNVERVLSMASSRLRLNPAATRFFKITVTAIFVAHISACFFYLAASSEIEKAYAIMYYPDDNSSAQPHDHYILCLHWAMQTITTAGYGDISATTSASFILQLILMILGLVFYSSIVANFFSLIQ